MIVRAEPAAQFWLVDKVHTRPSQTDTLVCFSESSTVTLLPFKTQKEVGVLTRSKNQTWAWAGCGGRVQPEVYRQISGAPGQEGMGEGFHPIIWDPGVKSHLFLR